jgi:hypothetical protein
MTRRGRGGRAAALGSLVIIAALTWGSSAVGSEPSARDDRRTLRLLEEEITKGVATQDAGLYQRVLADDYTTVSVFGLLRTKHELVVDAANKQDGNVTAASVRDVEVRVYGNAAVVTAIRDNVGGVLRGKDISGPIRTLRVYVRRRSEWQAVAFQMTRIE